MAGAAVAQLAEMFQQAERCEGAAACCRQLQRQFADVVCRDGKTGKQLVAALPPAGPVANLLKPESAWPLGNVEIGKGTPPVVRQVNFWGYCAMHYQNDPAPFFSSALLRYDSTQQSLLGFDGFGKRRWSMALAERNQPFMGFDPRQAGASVQGHLLVLPVGMKIVALDPAGLSAASDKSSEPPRPLWSQNLADSEADSVKNLKAKNHPVGQPVGQPPFGMYQPQMSTNTIGAITDRYVCFQRFHNLVAVDPLSGEPLWVRRDIPQGSHVFGDDRFIFVLPPDETAQATVSAKPKQPEAMVIRAVDGQLLGKRKLPGVIGDGNVISIRGVVVPGNMAIPGNPLVMGNPTHDVCLPVFGRKLLTWRLGSPQEHAVLELFDPWEQRAVWGPRNFSPLSQAAMVGHEAVAVMEPDGHFTLLGISDGHTIADLKLAAESGLSKITVIHSGQQYLLVTDSDKPGANPAGNVMFFPQDLPGTSGCPIQNGRLYAIDEQGKLMWPAPLEIKEQRFLLTQPERLPLIVFAGMVNVQRPNGPWMIKTRLLCVDKRTGRVLYRREVQQFPIILDIVGDPETKTVELRLQNMNETVKLAFTDKPLPPRSKLRDALWNAVEKSIKGDAP